MPRLNSHGAAVMGNGGPVTVDGVTYASAGTAAAWLNDDTIICQCADDQWRVSICKIGQPGQWAAYWDKGCNALTAGGGKWQAWLSGVQCYGEYGDQPGTALGLTDGDGRGNAGPNGEINIVPLDNLGIVIHSAAGRYAIASGPSYNVQILGPQAAVWADQAGIFRAEGVPQPAQTSPGGYPHYCLLPDGSTWNVCVSSVHGLIAHPWHDAREGVVLAPPGVFAFYPDAKVVQGKIVACWSSGAQELPHELVVCPDVLAQPWVTFGATPPNPEPGPTPPEPEPGPEPGPTPPEPLPGPTPVPPPDNGIDAAGVCVNPEHYFQSLTWDQDPRQFETVFRAIEDDLWRYGFGFQCRSDGTPSSRLYLPTAICPSAGAVTPEDEHLGVKQNPLCWSDEYTWAGADTIENDAAGNIVGWTWQPRGAGVYQPVPAPGIPPGPEPIPPALELGRGYLRTDHGDYLRAKRKTGELERGDAQLLSVDDLGNGRVSLRVAASGRYVCADPNIPDEPLYANRDAVGPWETFRIAVLDDGRLTFQAETNGYFVCAEDTGRVVCNRPTAGGWESFTFEPD